MSQLLTFVGLKLHLAICCALRLQCNVWKSFRLRLCVRMAVSYVQMHRFVKVYDKGNLFTSRYDRGRYNYKRRSDHLVVASILRTETEIDPKLWNWNPMLDRWQSRLRKWWNLDLGAATHARCVTLQTLQGA
ncbi:hypothetical protein L6164_004878 [Bauhinia variegata]|uniref:Uncharacterized protein n=1 Tax=Bauhinia variegata TaxID=167791 RepID=A0ACB9PV04_BAUVA|nr:hypothetical protein L6164_004878 [Bauhinia variegata]